VRYFGYILRNIRRNRVRSVLTIASTAACLFPMMILVSFFAISDEVNSSARIYNRIVTINANGFTAVVPIFYVQRIAQHEGVVAASPFNWYGGKYQNEVLPFSQFGVDPDKIFRILDEFIIAPEQLAEFQKMKFGCVIGRKLAEDKNIKVGDSLPLQGDLYPSDLGLKVCGIYDGPADRDLRMCLFNWEYLDDKLRKETRAMSPGAPIGPQDAGNAGMIVAKCKTSDLMPTLCKTFDDLFRNSEYPTRTQTEEAFGKMFDEMLGDLKGMVQMITLAVVFSLLCVAGNAMAMAMRERTGEVAVLKAIGFGRSLILFLVLTEAMLVAGAGGALGSLGCKVVCELVDLSQFTAGMLPVFYVPWSIALQGLAVSLFIGFASGLVPAIRAANLSVVDGLRRII
jgi:putative ABC transport system permease protein